MRIEKVDAHHHLWWMATAHYPMLSAPDVERFIGNTAGLKHDFGVEQLLPLAAAQNVIRSVYIESHFVPAIEETGWVQAVASAHGFPNAIIGRADLASRDVGDALDRHMQAPLFRGVRAMVNWDEDPMLRGVPEPDLLRRPDWRRGYAELGRRGLCAEIMAMPGQLLDLADLAAAVPATPLVVGHAGLPFNRTKAERRAWREGMTALAALPHVSVKISGLGMVDHHWSVATIAPIVLWLVDSFTPQRCMFASNFPVDGLHASYDRIWDGFDFVTESLPAQDRAALFRDTARRVYAIE